MRVKVGDQWFEAGPGRPVMVELTPADRRNIANMAESATRYALFHDADAAVPSDRKYGWMAE